MVADYGVVWIFLVRAMGLHYVYVKFVYVRVYVCVHAHVYVCV